jgi:hypothetical protein
MKPLSRRRFTGVLVGAVLTAALSTSAFAYFNSTGLGSAAAAVSQLTAPTIATATATAGGTVALTWSAATAPDTEAVKYYVTRDGEEPGGNCATPGSPSASTSCTDSGVPIGVHTYKVIAVWRSWSIASATKNATIVVGEVTHFTISAATTTPTVGASDNLTITAKDEKNATVTTYTGSHSLTFAGASSSPGGTAATVVNSSGTATAFGAATALTFTNGVAAVGSSKNGVMKIYRSGPAEISAGDGTVETEPPLQVNVTPGSATKLTAGAASTAPGAGQADDLTITAVDTYGNTAASYDGVKTLTFSGASASPSGAGPTVSNSSGTAVAFGTATSIAFEKGVASSIGVANGEMKLYKSGSTKVSVTDGTLTGSVTVTVAPAAASKLALTDSTTTPSATGTSNLTTTAVDPYGNTATGYTGSHEIVYSGAPSNPGGIVPTIVNASGTQVQFGKATALTFANGVAAVSSSRNGLMRLVKAGETNITASDGTISTAAPLALNVLIGAASKLAVTSVTATAGTISSTCFFTCPITGLGNSGKVTAAVSITDASANVVSAIGSGYTVKITSTGGTITGTPLTVEATGLAVSSGSFTYTAPTGNYSNTITVATNTGTVYTSATITTSK